MHPYQVTYHKHSCFQVEDDQCVFLFDWFGGEPPALDGSKMIYIFNSHKHGDHYDERLLQLVDRYPRIQLVLSREIKMPKGDPRFLAVKRGASYTLEGPVSLQVDTLASTDIGVAFLLHYNGQVIYHAGDLNWWSWSGESESWNRNMEARFRQIMEQLEGAHIDLAFVPLDPRQEERFNWGFDYFLHHTETTVVFPMHMWGQMDTVAKWKALPDSAPYRQRVMEPEREGQSFEIIF